MKPCILTALSWEGELPVPGQFLKAVRGRTAFLIIEVRPSPPGAKYVAKLVCERRSPATLHPSDKVFEWRWSSRG